MAFILGAKDAKHPAGHYSLTQNTAIQLHLYLPSPFPLLFFPSHQIIVLFKPLVSLSTSESSSYLLISPSSNHLAMILVSLDVCDDNNILAVKLKTWSYLSTPERCHFIIFWPSLFLMMSSVICNCVH